MPCLPPVMSPRHTLPPPLSQVSELEAENARLKQHNHQLTVALGGASEGGVPLALGALPCAGISSRPGSGAVMGMNSLTLDGYQVGGGGRAGPGVGGWVRLLCYCLCHCATA